MLKVMLANDGIGLAANQLGMTKRLFVMQVNRATRFCFNPVILDNRNGNLVTAEEGCLSFPKQIVLVTRQEEIQVRYENENGQKTSAVLKGLEARCFQHELAHLDGRTMYDDAKN